MKKSFNKVFFFVCIAIVFYSCSIEKRLYQPSYFVNWNGNIKHGADVLFDKSLEYETITDDSQILNQYKSKTPYLDESETTEMLLASIENIFFLKNEELSEIAYQKVENVLADYITDTCDIIVLHTGEKIQAKIIEVGIDVITYKRCNFPNGPTYSIKKSAIYYIQYPNGIVDNFLPLKEEKYHDFKKVEVFAMISMFLSIAGLFVAAVPLGITAIVLGVISLNIFMRNPDTYSGKFMAVLGIIIGFFDIVAVLMYLAKQQII